MVIREILQYRTQEEEFEQLLSYCYDDYIYTDPTCRSSSVEYHPIYIVDCATIHKGVQHPMAQV